VIEVNADLGLIIQIELTNRPNLKYLRFKTTKINIGTI